MDEDLAELWWKSSKTAEEDEEIRGENWEEPGGRIKTQTRNASRPACFTEKLLTQKNFNVQGAKKLLLRGLR